MDTQAAAEHLRLAFDLFEAGEAMMRSRLRRENPDADEAAIAAAIARWLSSRPGAEFGDFPGPASTRRIPS